MVELPRNLTKWLKHGRRKKTRRKFPVKYQVLALGFAVREDLWFSLNIGKEVLLLGQNFF